MQTHRSIFFIFTAALAVLSAGAACSYSSVRLPSPAAPSPIIVPAETQAPATPMPASPTPEVSMATFTAIPPVGSPEGTGLSVSYGNLALVVPNGLATSTTNSTGTEVEFPYINPSSGEMPQHIKVLLNGYPVQSTSLTPQVEVFPAAQYAQYTDLTRQIITTLQTTQFVDGQPLPAGLPGGELTAHVAAVQFANGRGIRYLAEFSEAPLPANNRDLIYYFHGLTAQGDSYVQVILPVTAPFLAPDSNPNSPLPAGGIPFNMDDIGGYFKAVADKLNATPPDQFAPSLAQLDALVQSIAIK